MKAIVFIAFAAVANCALLNHGGHSAHVAFPQPSFARSSFQQPSFGAKSFVQPQQQYHHGVVPVPSGADASAQVLRSESAVNPDSYQYAYETSNGIQGQEQGQLKQIGSESAIVSQGQFGWTSPEGTPVQLTFVADENGYQPSGSILPVAPETPAHVLRLVEYLRTHAPQQQESFAPVQPAQFGRQFGQQSAFPGFPAQNLKKFVG